MTDKERVFCDHCGAAFYRQADEHWKNLCISCFKKKKRAEENGWEEPRPWNDRWHRAQAPRQTLPRPAPPLVSDEDITRNLPHLLRLCHPDKHDNSQVSNAVMKWLLELRKKVKEQ